MKRLFFTACTAVLAMTLAFSCKSNQKGSEGTAEAAGQYLSPDLQMDDLTGSVKLCKSTTRACNEQGIAEDDMIWASVTKVYDQQGYIDVTSPDLDWRLTAPRLTRNDKQQITQVAWRVPEYDMDVTETYQYNADGTLKSVESEGVESIDQLEYTYDEDHHLLTSVSDGAGEGSVFRSTHEYTILATDDHGNWTRRLAKATYQSGPDDGSDTFDDTFVSYELEEREIVYY